MTSNKFTTILTMSVGLFLSTNLTTSAQSPSTFTDVQMSVYDVVLELFQGMHEGDSSMVHGVFHQHARILTSFYNNNGEAELIHGDLTEFLKAVASPRELSWDERIRNPEIRIDDNIAQMWSEYAFYLGGELSHCGVDAFHLVREEGDWKIVQITYTRRPEGCSSWE